MFGIVLGVAVILAISITNLSTLASINNLFSEASGKANLVVTSSASGESGIREDLVRRIISVHGVRFAIPTLHVQTLLADEVSSSQVDMSFFGQVTGGLELYGVDPNLDTSAREYKIVAGRFLSPDLNVHEVVLVKDYAEQKRLGVGGDLRILTPGGVEPLRIVGLMSKEGPGLLNNGAFGVLPLNAAQTLFGREGELDQIEIVATPQAAAGGGLDLLKQALQARLGKSYSVIYPATQGKRVTQMVNTYQLGLNFFSVIALFVGAFLIYNAFSMTVVERTREIGMLRTIGMTRPQIMRQILSEAVVLGLVGAALGVALGIVLAQGLIRLMELLVGQEVTPAGVPLDGLATSILVGLGVTLAAALIPAWQAGRISPLEALRIRGNPQEGWMVTRGWLLGLVLITLAYLSFFLNPFPPAWQYQVGSTGVFALFVGATLLIPVTVSAWERAVRSGMRRLYGNEGELGARNTQRAKLRTTLTVAALMVGVAMILGIRSLTDSFEHDIRDWINVYIGGDLFVYSNLPLDPGFESKLESIEGVVAAAPVRYLNTNEINVDGSQDPLAFMAVDPASYRRVTSFAFTSNQGDPGTLLDRLSLGDGVFISSVVSERYGLKQGDSIRLKTRRGDRSFPIVAVVVDFYNQGLVIEGSWRDMQRYYGVNDAAAFLLKLAPGQAPETVKANIDSTYGKQLHLTVESNSAIKGRALQLTSQAFTLFDVLATIAVVVAALGVVNTMMMNVLERTQEIGMLRSLGMTRLQVIKMVLAEAGIMGLIGGAFGLAFGLFLSRLFLIAITQVQGYDLSYILPTQGILISVVIALIVSQLAGLLPARRAASIRIIESIHFE
jgi:putative ABC transport system permease protein